MSEASEPETLIGINGYFENGTLYIGGCAEFFFVLDDALSMCRTTVGVMEDSFDGKLASLQNTQYSMGSIRRGLKHKNDCITKSKWEQCKAASGQ